MDTFANIVVYGCTAFGLGLFSYGFYGYMKDTIIPLWNIRKDLDA